MSLFEELKRRKVFKVAVAYAVVGWLLIQVAATAFPAFDIPNWALRLVMLVVLLGFPIAIVLAWIFDVTAAGVKMDSSRTGSKSMIAAAAVLALLALGWYFNDRPMFRKGDSPPVAASAAPTEAASAASAAPAKSIAVLAFTDLSPKHDQDYFSDGIAEELLDALAQVRDLKVAARTSSFYYKGRNEDLRIIGKALGVANVLEGSVRTQGDQVRITAQLIRSADGFHLWSESYDGNLTDVFKLQENIARAITEALQVVLSGDQGERLVNSGTDNTEAYGLYLQARAAYRARGSDVQRSIDLYHAALALDPKFAPAWAGLCGSLNVLPFYLPANEKSRVQQIQSDAEAAGKRAIELDAGLASAHIMLGNLYTNEWRWALAEQHFQRAQALAPNDPEFYFAYTDWLAAQGRSNDALDAARKAVELDPMAPMPKNLYGYLLYYSGRYDESIAQLQAGYALAPKVLYFTGNLFEAYILAGRVEDAEKVGERWSALMRAIGARDSDIADGKALGNAALRIARDPGRYAVERKALGEKGAELARFFPSHIDDLFTSVEAQIDRPDKSVDAVTLLRSPFFAHYHADPRYLRLLRKTGFDDAGNIQ